MQIINEIHYQPQRLLRIRAGGALHCPYLLESCTLTGQSLMPQHCCIVTTLGRQHNINIGFLHCMPSATARLYSKLVYGPQTVTLNVMELEGNLCLAEVVCGHHMSLFE